MSSSFPATTSIRWTTEDDRVPHKEQDAACTIAVYEVPMEEAPRFGILNTNPDGSIHEFDEKPAVPKSNKASMGIYVFTWSKLRDYLIADEKGPEFLE